jgi:hypothetical protein
MCAEISKRHHWWPQCHSGLWIDAEGCITVTNAAAEVRRTRPVNTAVIGHFNSLKKPDGTFDTSLETYFADEVDGPAAPVLARLATEKRLDPEVESHFDRAFLRASWKGIKEDGFVPSERAYTARIGGDEKLALARYVASLMTRVPSYKNELNSNRMRSNVAAILGLEPDGARFETDALHLEIVRRHLADYAARLAKCEFILIDSENEELVIGDTPVIPATLGFGESEALMPLSPTRAILFIRGHKAPVPGRALIFASQRRSVRAYNRTMLQNAEREVFSRAPINPGFVRRHLGTRQIRLVPDIATAAGAHSERGPMLDPPAPDMQWDQQRG